jgi:hypothetical protein
LMDPPPYLPPGYTPNTSSSPPTALPLAHLPPPQTDTTNDTPPPPPANTTPDNPDQSPRPLSYEQACSTSLDYDPFCTGDIESQNGAAPPPYNEARRAQQYAGREPFGFIGVLDKRRICGFKSTTVIVVVSFSNIWGKAVCKPRLNGFGLWTRGEGSADDDGNVGCDTYYGGDYCGRRCGVSVGCQELWGQWGELLGWF